MTGKLRIAFCNDQCCDDTYYAAVQAKRAIQRAGIDLFFQSGRLMRRYDSGQAYQLRSVGMKSLLSEVAEFHCDKRGRSRVTDAPRQVVSRLMCRTTGMRFWPEVLP